MEGIEAEEDVAISMDSVNISGRSTMFTCLSCGMPFSFPDESYTSDDKDIQEMLQFVHSVRLEIRRNDKSKASTAQWQVCDLRERDREREREREIGVLECNNLERNISQANKSHYLHKFLHGSIVMHTSLLDPDHLERIFKQNR
jgi:hypothetical protein